MSEIYKIDIVDDENCSIFCMKKDSPLLKAAPMMLEALEAVVRVADRATVEFDMARAAIKAAKGEV